MDATQAALGRLGSVWCAPGGATGRHPGSRFPSSPMANADPRPFWSHWSHSTKKKPEHPPPSARWFLDGLRPVSPLSTGLGPSPSPQRWRPSAGAQQRRLDLVVDLRFVTPPPLPLLAAAATATTTTPGGHGDSPGGSRGRNSPSLSFSLLFLSSSSSPRFLSLSLPLSPSLPSFASLSSSQLVRTH